MLNLSTNTAAGRNQPAISMRNINKWYGALHVLRNVNLECIAAIKVRFSVNQDETRAGV